ncbi:MAG: O-methyltransferase [Myxococcales bacterium]|nr:O-methyltransferase [Myxococcales bacterium]
MEMNAARWRYTREYLGEVFGREDPELASLASDAAAAGLPTIAVSAEVGRLLKMLVGLTPGRRAVELGTLGGYSAAWIARGLAPGGHLTTVELDPRHADFAEGQLARLGLADRVEVRRGAALDVLAQLAEAWPAGSVDFAFVDAVKREYPAYFEALHPLLGPGAILVVDNVLGTNSWWIDSEDSPDRAAADQLNRGVAAHAGYEAVGLPLREGLLVARKR